MLSNYRGILQSAQYHRCPCMKQTQNLAEDAGIYKFLLCGHTFQNEIIKLSHHSHLHCTNKCVTNAPPPPFLFVLLSLLQFLKAVYIVGNFRFIIIIIIIF